MRLTVLGAGLMGRAAAWEFLQGSTVDEVMLADVDPEALASAAVFLGDAGDDRLRIEPADLSDEDAAVRLLEGTDAVLSAVPYRFNGMLARAALRAGAHFCDLGGNSWVVDEELALDAEAREAGVTIIPDCGLAPGMTNILVAALLEHLPEADTVAIRVGGLPAHPRPPLNYKLVFSPSGLINEYVEPCRILRAGEAIEVPPLSEPETVVFPAPYGDLEARHTSGGTSTLPGTYSGRLRSLEYKTLRYPGHYPAMDGMLDLGLFSSEPVQVGDVEIVPRKMIEERLAANLQDDDTDVVLIRVTATAPSGRGLTTQLIDTHDAKTGLSAMQRTTALPAAVICRMMADGRIAPGGARPPELAVPTVHFLDEVSSYGITFVFNEM